MEKRDHAQRARQLFASIAILNALDRAERRATAMQFAWAAKIAARIVVNARASSAELLGYKPYQ